MFCSGLNYYISIKAPQRTAELKAIYEEEFRRAADQDEDRASLDKYESGIVQCNG